MSIFSRNIQLLGCLISFSVSSVFPQVLNSKNIKARCEQMIVLALLQDFNLLGNPKEYEEHFVKQVFQQSTIDFIVKSIQEKSVDEKISSGNICSVISDTLYQIKAFAPCPQKIQILVQRMENQNRNVFYQPIDYQVVDAAWFVINAIMTMHFQSWDDCYESVSVFRTSSFTVSNYLTLADVEFDKFWKNCMQRPEIFSLIEDEYLYQKCVSSYNPSEEIFSQRMLDLYACIIHTLHVENLPYWSTLFPPKTLKGIISNWTSAFPQNIHRIPILSLLMNMFAYGWAWQKNPCCNNIVIREKFRSAIKEVLQPLQIKQVTKKTNKPKKRKK